MTVWQIAAGGNQREFHDLFLKHGIAFVGGDKQIKSLMQIQKGDIIALKRGLSEVVAVGQVVERNGKYNGIGDKDWLLHLDGWSLEAYVYVDWRTLSSPLNPQGLTRGTVLRVNQPNLKEGIINAFESGNQITDRAKEPRETQKVEDEEILTDLIKTGLSPFHAETLTSAFVRIRRLANYYRNNCNWEEVREHETRTFLVVPLLLSLGWSEQQIKIELSSKRAGRNGRIDIACYEKPYHIKDCRKCKLLIETKGFTQGLSYADEQAKEYALYFPEAPHLVVTNGYCYKLYERRNDVYLNYPSAYMNLLDPRSKYPLDPDRTDGCLEVLKALLP